MKYVIIGYSGSGKSTLAKDISSIYNIPCLHIDSINFKENWVVRDFAEINTDIIYFMKNDSYVIDGNYRKLAPNRFDDADVILFMNFNRLKCLYGALKRYFKFRNKVRPDIAKGCKEKFDFEFFKWIIKDGRNKERKNWNKELIEKYKDKIIVFKKRKQVKKYLDSIR